MNGFLNLLKPAGMTSAACVGMIRRLTGEKRVGHAGTLDPDAAGVLPVMIGRATRLFDVLTDKEKTYIAEAAFGFATDTQDASGRIVASGTVYPSIEAVRAAAQSLVGDTEQRPGAYSAIRMDGRRLYELARAGKQVEAPARIVHIESIDVMRELPDHGFLMKVVCGRGTYIRSVCEDLGRLCGCPAHMRFLLRAKSGIFTAENAVTPEEARAAAEAGTISSLLLPMDAPLGHLPRADAPAALAKAVRNGAKLPASLTDVPEGATVRVYLNDRFWGIAVREADQLVWRAQLPPEEEEPD